MLGEEWKVIDGSFGNENSILCKGEEETSCCLREEDNVIEGGMPLLMIRCRSG